MHSAVSDKTTLWRRLTGQLPPSAQKPDTRTDRAYWLDVTDRLSRPVLENLAHNRLRSRMPVEQKPSRNREDCTHLEAYGRLMCGLAPWLALNNLTGHEATQQETFRQWALAGLENATHPSAPDYMNFGSGKQPLVDAAFLAQAFLRAPEILWTPLSEPLKAQVITAMEAARRIVPHNNNWVLFAAMVEAFFLLAGHKTQAERLEDNLSRMLGWYIGDGAYADGPKHHHDYYNAFVINPMLLDIFTLLKNADPRFEPHYEQVLQRSVRYAEVQERTIAPDGTFPPVGRSIAYRFGAFQTLSQIALMQQLPASLKPSQVRTALTAVIRRTIEAKDTFTAEGWLRIGLCGHQPALGETYISTGSLYLCAAGLLPLGLPESDPFWRDPPELWTAQKIWSGQDLPADKAMTDKEIPDDLPTLRR